MPAITHTPQVLKFKKLLMSGVDGDGEQWDFYFTFGRSVDSYKSFVKSFDNIN